jgi:ankyrin repeat protein
VKKNRKSTFWTFILAALFIFSAPLPLTAEDTGLFEAVKNNDAAGVRSLISQGYDVNARSKNRTTPLFHAVVLGYGEIAELLIKAGADVDQSVEFQREGPMSPVGYSLTVHALIRGKHEMVGLLLRHGADPAKIHRYYRYHFYRLLSTGDFTGARRLAEKPHFAFEPDLALLAYYHDGPSELRRLLKEAFPSVSLNRSAMLETLLALENDDIHSHHNFPNPLFPLASSYLPDDKFPQRYTEAMAFDGDLSTSWVEGVEGPGTGEKIAFEIPPVQSR